MDLSLPTQTQPEPTSKAIPAMPTTTLVRPFPAIKQSRPGRAAGSQGYSIQDMLVLAECVSAVLPLGTTEWNQVLEKYNDYARQSGRALRAYHSLRTKFRAIVQHPNYTGVLEDCPRYVQLAKRAAKSIEERSCLLVSQNPNWAESDEERTTSVPVQVSARSATIEDDERVTQGNVEISTDQTHVNPQTQVDSVENLAVNTPAPNRTSEDRSQSSASPVMIPTESLLSAGRSKTSPIRNAARCAPKIINHPSRSNRFSPLGSRGRQDISLNARRARGSTAGATNPIREYLEPEANSSSNKRDRDADRGLVEFYLMKLQEANETVIRLQGEGSRLREAHTARLQGLEDENRRLRDNLLQQTVKTECLQGQLEMMSRLWELSKASSFGFFQPGPAANQNLNIPLPNSNLQPSAPSLPHMAPSRPDNNPSSNLQPPSSSSLLAEQPPPPLSTSPSSHEQRNHESTHAPL